MSAVRAFQGIARFAIFGCLLALLVTPKAALGADRNPLPAGIELGEAWTVPLVSALGEPSEKPNLRILEQSETDLLLEFTLPVLSVQSLEAENETFHFLAFEDGAMEGEEGQPMLPIYSRLIHIPDRAGVSFEVIAVETERLSGLRPFPMQPEVSDAFVIDRAAYTEEGLTAKPLVNIGAPALARDLRVVPITIAPVRYDPAAATIEVVKRVEVRVRFSGIDLRNAASGSHRRVPGSFDRLYRDMVVNYEGGQDDGLGRETSAGNFVIICPDQADVITALQPLIEWRMRRGFHVRLATLSETGSSPEEIKGWLGNAFNYGDEPPEYVCLVGDADGSIAIPAWEYGGGVTDHQYSLLSGADMLADVFVGRISVDSVDRLRLYVAKMVGYESAPYMTDTSWFRRACLVGDPGASGYSCLQIMQWIKSRLLARGYAQVDTVFTEPWTSQMVSALNRGDTVFAYRGYYGTSGFTTGHVASLTNGWKMPFAPTLTCGTGNFSGGTSLSEAWIRAGVPPDRPTGGIASMGMSTLSTVTKYNNALMFGIWHAILVEDQFRFGQASVRGKYELYANYGTGGTGLNHMHWANLMGDPAGEIWTGIPQSMVVSHPASLPRGTSSVRVTVTAQGLPCAGASVCLWKGDETHVTGMTDGTGAVELAVDAPTTGTMKITVTKHDHLAYLADISVINADFVGYIAHSIDDDASGTSAGNGDGIVNPAETIELPIQIQNFGSNPITNVTGTLDCDDPYVVLLDGTESFGDVAAGATAWSADDFDFRVEEGAPAGHVIQLGLDLQSGASSWHSLFELTVASAELQYRLVSTYDVGGQFDPGETGQLSVKLLNIGTAAAQAMTGILVSESPWVTVVDSTGAFGDIPVNASGENATDRFTISAQADCYPGHQAPMKMVLSFSGGARDTVAWSLPIGTAASDDPTGPDTHGYYAFDNTDIMYPLAPAYSWVEIDPNYGGPGVSVGLTDFGTAQDDSRTVTLPFSFLFYGRLFTQTTICSNGWMCMGSSYLANWNNWTIPGAGAPPFLIAPMWDELHQEGTNQVYHWYDSAQHRYIVQWSRVQNLRDDEQNFEVILYDPAFYPTGSGDGEIVFQYHTFHNTDSSENYCTVGIENEDQTTGVLYTYANQYTAGSPAITSGRAIKFATYSVVPSGVLMGTIRNATGGGTPLAMAEVRLLESGRLLTSGADGLYGGSTSVGSYTAVASHPSFAADTVSNVVIVEGHTTTLDFSLIDIAPPLFSETTVLPNTGDTIGPYRVTARVTEHSPLAELILRYEAGAEWVDVPMTALGDDLYAGDIPGQPHGTRVRYYLVGEDAGGNAATDPAGAPTGAYLFWVLQPLFLDDMEAGAGGWQHYALGESYADQWHLSTTRNHTPDGSESWKFGDTADGDYANLSGGALESQAVWLADGALLTFWHWIEAEVSGSYTGYCYDGGLVEMSVDDGPWTQITPVGGYPYRIRTGSTPGPLPAETPVFSGTLDWTQVQFDLSEVTGLVRLRFVFGTDGAVVREGWHLDDLMLLPTGPGASAAGEPQQKPVRLALHPSAPNPFRAGSSSSVATSIRFDLPEAGRAQVQIIDLSGRLIRSLLDAELPAGTHAVTWDGRDGRAHPLASGRYFCVLRANGSHETRELLLIR